MSKETTALSRIETINALEVFTGEGIDPLLDEIEKEARSLVIDAETPKGRKEIKSMAHRVSKAKVMLDNAGKSLCSEWKQKAKTVDEARLKIRTRLDLLRDEVKAPALEWESEEAARIEQIRIAEEERLAADLFELQVSNDVSAAITENELFDMRKAEAARIEAERIEKEKREAEDRAQREEKERLEQEVADAKKREEEAAAEAERKEAERLQAIETARIEKENAVKEERRKAEEREAGTARSGGTSAAAGAGTERTGRADP